jgi:CRP-like cAMP-binding protein
MILLAPQGAPDSARPAGAEEAATSWKSHPFLQSFSSEHQATLAECAMPTTFKAGQLIFREGEMANRFYLILEGRAALEAEAEDRPAVVVDSVAAGEVLGWSWLFPPYTWNFTARALEPVRAIFFYGTWLRERCATDPALGYELMRHTASILIRRLQATRKELIRLAAAPGHHG